MEYSVWKWNILLCLLLLVLDAKHYHPQRRKSPRPNTFCRCKNLSPYEKRCMCTSKRRSLNYFPRVPAETNQYTYSANYMPHLTREKLSNLTDLQLQVLYLRDNKISGIDSEAFTDLKFLERLEISRNSMNPAEVGQALKSLSKSIERLDFNDNDWKTLPENMFDGLEGTNITIISLKDNKLISFNGSLLRRIPNLKELYLDKNPIYDKGLDFRNMKYMFKLKLTDTRLQKVPKFCDRHGNSFLPRLRSLDLDRTYINTFSASSFRCLPFLWKLSLSFINVRRLRNNIFASLPSLQTLRLNNIPHIKNIYDFAFNSTTLRKLTFTGNFFRFDKRDRYIGDMFQHCPNVEDLDLSGNHIESGLNLKRLLWPLINLTRVKVVGCFINDLRPDTFNRIPKLQILELNGNKINGWDPDMFSKNFNLKKLLLNGNNIAVVNKTSFPLGILNNLDEINLSNNPFSCVCQQLWFRDWLLSTNVTRKSYPQRYVCRSPPEWDKQLLKDFSYTQEDCIEKNPWVMIGIVLASFSFLCCAIVLLIYFHLPTVRNIIYILRIKKSGYVRFINNVFYSFDAYVLSCEADEEWLFKTLVPKLEQENDKKLCIPVRDFHVGECYVDEIMVNMTKSRKIIVVMSNAFIKDEWCQYQIQLVQERIRSQGKEVVVMVVLSDIDNRHMTTAIKELLRQVSFVTWVSGKLREQLFWAVFMSALTEAFKPPPVPVL